MRQSQQSAANTSILDVYRALDAVYQDDVWHWMPAIVDDPMDIITGAVLVQHTTWVNAERAVAALRAAGVLDPATLAVMPEAEIAALVRASGAPSVKARRLHALAETIVRAGGLRAFLALPAETLRSQLLTTHGVGPETADDIALYAAGRAVFIVDAYTRRMFGRIGLRPTGDSYGAWQAHFEDALGGGSARALHDPATSHAREDLLEIYRRYHGYIVLHSKATCRAIPRCAACPLLPICADGQARTNTAAAIAAPLARS